MLFGRKKREFVIRPGKYGKEMLLLKPWDKSVVRLLEKEAIDELLVVTPDGFVRESLDFLADVPWLKRFSCLDRSVKNIEGVHCLTHLRWIYMGDYSNKPIDFTRFPHLEQCRMEFGKNRMSVTSCTNLTDLYMIHYSYKDLSPIRKLSGLTCLAFTQGSLKDISEIGSFENLRDLNLILLRGLKDVSPISKTRVVKLDLRSSSNIGRLDGLVDMETLRYLDISGCKNIESLAPLLQCKNLEVLYFCENTNILDGDMEVLLRMPNLKYCAFANRRHYNMKRDDVPTFWAPFPDEWRYKGPPIELILD